jgi:hypothetical protein
MERPDSQRARPRRNAHDLFMSARAELDAREELLREDHFVYFHGVSWDDYERVLEMRGDRSAPRITYLEGTLEIMLGVPEVWFWEKGAIRVYRLRGERYVQARASVALRGIDVAELASFLDRPTTSRAIRDYSAALKKRR